MVKGGGVKDLVATLRAPGRVLTYLADREVSVGDYLYVPGTGHFHILNAAELARESAEWDSLPSGALPIPRLVSHASGQEFPLAAGEPTLAPEGVIRLNPYWTWKSTRPIRINTGSGGAAIGETLFGFPLLIHLDSSRFDFSQARGKGEDIRFARADGTPLPHEIESWDSSGKRADIWVRVDTLFADSVVGIQMHAGNPAASEGSAAASVFGPGMNYMGAWHLAAVPPGNDVYPELSGDGSTVIAGKGPLGSDASALTGGAVSLNGQDQYLFTDKRVQAPQTFSLSLWFRTDTRVGGKLLVFGDSLLPKESFNIDRFLWMSDDGKVNFGLFSVDLDKQILSSAQAYNDGAWHQVTGVVSATGSALYVDGGQVAARSDIRAGSLINYAGYWSLGHNVKTAEPWLLAPSGLFFQGSLDEARVETRVLSPDWVKMSYQMQRPGGGVVLFP